MITENGYGAYSNDTVNDSYRTGYYSVSVQLVYHFPIGVILCILTACFGD